MRHTSKHKMLRIAAGSLLAAGSMFGTAGMAFAEGEGGGGSTPPDEGPGPSIPNLPENPIEEGLPIPLPGGGG